MAFVGLVPTEHSSGESQRRGSITKAGNSHVRRLLVEAAWHAHKRPKVSYELRRRQHDQDPVVIERAWRPQQRLHRRWRRMAGRGKPSQKTVVMRHQPVTRDARQRRLPTDTSHAVPTRECQSDPPSLPRAIRYCRPSGNHQTRALPLTIRSMSVPRPETYGLVGERKPSMARMPESTPSSATRDSEDTG
jgi:Transposase IS116/IS110/IS902 family